MAADGFPRARWNSVSPADEAFGLQRADTVIERAPTTDVLRMAAATEPAAVTPDDGRKPDLSLSILIATRDRPGLVPRAVAAALAACPPDAEVIVVDDGSQPPASDALRRFAGDTRLTVIVNAGPHGAARARNLGVSKARGRVILFADDDDELLPHYAARVVAIAGDVARPIFGFCAIVVLEEGVQLPADTSRRRYRTGRMPPHTPLRHRISGLGTGFWVLRERFMAAGGLDTDQRLDEDTSLCCALIAQGNQPWYESEPGMIVHLGHSQDDSAGAQLTRATPSAVVVACYLRTWKHHDCSFPPLSAERWFLGTRYLRRAVKAGQLRDGLRFCLVVRPRLFAGGFVAYWALKALAYTLRARRVN
jgi:hypothetical protein